MISLRVKLTAALLGTSLAVLAVLGLTARNVTMSRFDDLVLQRAAENFAGDMVAFYELHGSWEATANESFTDFLRADRGRSSGPGRLGRPPGRGGGPAGRPPGRAGGPDGPGPPPGVAEAGGLTRFVVVDESGNILNAPPGDPERWDVDLYDIDAGLPLESNGEVIGYAIPLDNPARTALEEQYLSSIEQAWLYSLGAGLLLAIPLGLVLGGRLSRSATTLSDAMTAMADGDLRQEVDIDSNDEIGRLADAFNQMSVKLSSTYEELERSHATISEQADRLRELSSTDALTGLSNRRAFDRQADRLYAQAKRYERPLVFMMGDIDHFKRINDEFGHATGDEVLRTVAELFRVNTREIDVVARYGGEEFVIGFPETPLDDALRLSERLRTGVRAHPWHDLAPGLAVTVSMGLNGNTELGGFDAMLAAADQKLYEAKQSGRDLIRA